MSGARGNQQLDRQAFAPINAQAIAVPSRDGRFLAYDSWQETRPVDPVKSYADQGIANGDLLGIPTVRVRDLQTKTESALEAGSFGASWSPSGALAYTVVDPAPGYRANEPILTKIVVRRSPGAAAEVWTPTRAHYGVFGWAGDTLIAAEGGPGEQGATVYALDGPGRLRPLFSHVGVLAISPDGTELLVVTDLMPPGAGVLRRKRISDGVETASLPLTRIVDPVTKEPARFVDGGTHWAGDRILVATDSGFAVLKAGPGELAVEQTLHFDLGAYTSGSVYEPRLAGPDLGSLVFWTGLPRTVAAQQRSVQIVCDRTKLTCIRQPPGPPRNPPHPVYDRSGGSR